LEQTVEDARFPYTPRLCPLKTILEKLVPPRPRPPSAAGGGANSASSPWAEGRRDHLSDD
jgi:hypothetical protein